MTHWQGLHPLMTLEHLGYVPDFFDDNDPRPAAVQIAERYIGGWRPMTKFRMLGDGTLIYPGDPPDPPMRPLAVCQFRHERLLFYPSSWLAIVQPDGSYEVSRVD